MINETEEFIYPGGISSLDVGLCDTCGLVDIDTLVPDTKYDDVFYCESCFLDRKSNVDKVRDEKTTTQKLIDDLVKQGIYDQKVSTLIHKNIPMSQKEIEWEFTQIK